MKEEQVKKALQFSRGKVTIFPKEGAGWWSKAFDLEKLDWLISYKYEYPALVICYEFESLEGKEFFTAERFYLKDIESIEMVVTYN